VENLEEKGGRERRKERKKPNHENAKLVTVETEDNVAIKKMWETSGRSRRSKKGDGNVKQKKRRKGEKKMHGQRHTRPRNYREGG